MIKLAYQLAESGQFPDSFIRFGIRKLLRQKLEKERSGGAAAARERLMKFIETLRDSPIAIHTDAANEQHYELPPAFFETVLGKYLKYSCCWYETEQDGLDRAEETMLALTADRAGIADGQDILELGCGWGSLTLWNAEHYPGSRITAVSNSGPQREFIMARAAERGLNNIEVITCDMREFSIDRSFDRVVSVEMFEHMRNYPELFKRIAGWLRDDGRFFMHIFTHRDVAYPYETTGPDDWMGLYFFTGGIMPADALPLYFQEHLLIEDHWIVNGQHYERTSNDWLKKMDAHRETIMPVMAETYGESDAAKWFQRWRIFFMACAELWGYAGGEEWFVSHYRFRKR